MARQTWAQRRKADEAQRRAAPPIDPAKAWRLVINGVPRGQDHETGAHAELERVVREENVEIPMAYHDDRYGRVNTASVHLERWDGCQWVVVPDTTRKIVLSVTLGGEHER
jgi:hypothetical protein